MGSLEQKVKERIKEAEDKNISGKARIIAKYLGYGTDKEEYTNLQFENDSFNIKYNFSSKYSGDPEYGDVVSSSESVEYKGQTVFDEQNHEIKSYISGAWEKEFESLYAKADRKMKLENAKAKRAEQNAKREAKRKEDTEIRKKFGL